MAEAGGTPYIPFKSNSVIPKEGSIWARMYHLFMFNWETFTEHYNKWRNAESVFSMIKRASSVTQCGLGVT